MPVTRHPPCSPGRAVFPHPVPRLSSPPRCKAGSSRQHPPSFGLRDTRPCSLDAIEARRARLPGKTRPLPASSIAPWAPDSIRVGGSPLPDRDFHPARDAKLFLARERWVSAAAGSQSAADAGDSQLQALVLGPCRSSRADKSVPDPFSFLTRDAHGHSR